MIGPGVFPNRQFQLLTPVRVVEPVCDVACCRYRRAVTIGRVLAATVDCAEPAALARFWLRLVGGEIDLRTVSHNWVALRDVPGIGNLGFQKVPEGKSTKNRVHLDIEVESIEEAAAEAVRAGATVRGTTIEEPTNFLLVMLDPEDNEFCLIRRKG